MPRKKAKLTKAQCALRWRLLCDYRKTRSDSELIRCAVPVVVSTAKMIEAIYNITEKLDA